MPYSDRRNNIVEIRYETADKSYFAKYQIQLDDNIWVYKDKNGAAHLTKCNCKCVLMEGKLNGNILPHSNPIRECKTIIIFIMRHWTRHYRKYMTLK